jgi:hypothetical protein
MRAEQVCVLWGIDPKNVHTFFKEFTRETDVFSSLKFISCEHPHFDACSLQVMNGRWDIRLQTVFY